MGFLIFSSFFETLKETIKIFFRNGKLLPSITLLNVSVNTILMLSYLFTVKYLLTDYTTKLTDLVLESMSTDGPESLTGDNSYLVHVAALMKHELVRFVIAYLMFIVAIALASFFFAIATILASAESFSGKKLCVKDLVSMTRKSGARVLVTYAYTTLLGLGYELLILVFIFLPIELIFFDSVLPGKLSSISLVALVLAAIFYFYLAVVWTLALVVSVLEDKCGFEALWKASELAKGLRLKGFLLKLLFEGIGLSFAGFQIWRLSSKSKKSNLDASVGMNAFPFILLIFISTLTGMFSLISYTVLYFEGKKIHGDEVVEMKGYTVEYAKLPASAPLSSSDIP